MTMSTPASRTTAKAWGWFHGRKLRWFLVLLALGVGAWFALPWILMPADLRRMQGTWKIVRYVEGDKEIERDEESVIITGSRLTVLMKGTQTAGLRCSVDTGRHLFFVHV